jgi:hypothetical protein
MNEPTTIDHDRTLTPEQVQTALFAQLVMQQANLAFLFLGKEPNPQTGKPMRDLEGARMLIDQLEMLQAKTKGNLNREEEALLKQSLMSVQLAFVDATNERPETAAAAPETPPAQPAPAAPEPAPAPAQPSAPASEESHKKFSKKY